MDKEHLHPEKVAPKCQSSLALGSETACLQLVYTVDIYTQPRVSSTTGRKGVQDMRMLHTRSHDFTIGDVQSTSYVATMYLKTSKAQTYLSS
eukprot:4551946-Amphidinium_carterae.1